MADTFSVRRLANVALVTLAVACSNSKQNQPSVAADSTAAQKALTAGVDYLARFPVESLRFDAAVGTYFIQEAAPGPRARAAFDRALPVGRRDDDNPLRRLFDPEMRVAAEAAIGWEAPVEEGARRVSTNRVVGEAVHCADHGFRDQTLGYLRGPMRDDGGYQTTHALWALGIARANDCLSLETFERVRSELADEIRAALARDDAPRSVGEVDLFAERLLVLHLVDEPFANPAEQIQRLVAQQQPDGSFGVADETTSDYARYHATMAVCWLLAVWESP